MQIGFEFTAAKPKGLRAAGDEPVQQSMRPREVTVSKNPSADQKRVRRQMARQQRTAAEKGDLFRHEPHPCPVCRKPCPFVSDHGDVLVYNCPMHGTFNVPRRGGSKEVRASKTATQFDTSADRLNPGDSIRLPHGQTVNVRQVRNHESSANHVYLDTDQGTTLVQRKDPFTVVPANNVQQELPGYGTPGGTSDNLPGMSSGSSYGGQDLDQDQAANCPMCGTLMSRHGQTFVCPRDGFSQQTGGANGLDYFSDNTRISPRGASMQHAAALDDVGDCRLCGGDLKHLSSDGSNIHARCTDCGTDHNLQGKVDDDAHRIGAITREASTFTERQWRHLAAIQTLAADWDAIDATPCPKCGNTGSHKYRGGGSGGAEGSHTLVECNKCSHRFKVKHHKHSSKYDSLRFASLRWAPLHDTSRYTAPHMSALARRAHAVLDTPEGTL